MWFCADSVEGVESDSGAAVSHLNQPFPFEKLVRKGLDSKTDLVFIWDS